MADYLDFLGAGDRGAIAGNQNGMRGMSRRKFANYPYQKRVRMNGEAHGKLRLTRFSRRLNLRFGLMFPPSSALLEEERRLKAAASRELWSNPDRARNLLTAKRDRSSESDRRAPSCPPCPCHHCQYRVAERCLLQYRNPCRCQPG